MVVLSHRCFIPLCAVFLALGAALPIAAQEAPVLTGRVLDAETEQPLIGATVGVWKRGTPAADADSTLVGGATTDTEGAFQVEALPTGLYRVIVSFVGYRPRQQSGVAVEEGAPPLDLGTVLLEPGAAVLEAVAVEAERQRVQVEIDRTVYNTAADPVSDGGTATTVLESIPSVTVDVDGNVSLRGSGSVTVLINGRPAPVSRENLASYLQQLSASAIERVEVIPNPSARYEPDGQSGILNIVLAEDADPGLGGSFTAGVDSRGGYSGTSAGTYGRGPWDLTASVNWRQEEGGGGGSSYRINRYAMPLTYLDQEEDEDESETSQRVSLNATYSLSDQTALSAVVGIGREREDEDELNRNRLLNAAQQLTEETRRLAATEETQWDGDLRLGFDHDFGDRKGRADGGRRVNHTLSSEARFNASGEGQTETLTERDLLNEGLSEEQQVFSNEARWEASLQADYVRPLGEAGRVEAGYKGDLERLNEDLDSEVIVGDQPEVSSDNAFLYDERIHAAYVQAGTEIGRLGVQGGLRFETASTQFELTQASDTYDGPLSFDNTYTTVFPSAFFTFSLNDANTLKASYSRRIDRPNSWRLNPFPSFDDPLNIRIGNPQLEPEYVDAFETGYVRSTGWGSLTLTPYYRRTTNVVRRVSTVREDGVTVRTFENLDTANAYGVETVGFMEGSGALEGLSGYVSLEGFRVQSSGTVGGGAGEGLENDAFGWGGRVNMNYNLGDRFGVGETDMQVSLRYRAPLDSEQGRIGSRIFGDVALRQALLNDRAGVTIRFRDPLGLAGFQYTLDQPDLYQEFERNWGAQQLGVTFTYSFQNRDAGEDDGRRDGPGGGFSDDFDY